MHFATVTIAIGALVGSVSAVAQPGFQFPAIVPLEKRQTSGPAYDCHADCGYAIQNSAKDGYCKDPAWTKLLDGCLDCALKYDIWKWYGDKVSSAAKQCGLDATPKPANGGGASASASQGNGGKTTAPGAPSSAAPQAQTTAATQTRAPSPAETGRAPGQATSHAAPVGTVSAHSSSPANSTASGQPPAVTAGGSHTAISGVAIIVAAVIVGLY